MLLQDLLKITMRLLQCIKLLLVTWEFIGNMFKTRTSLFLPSKLKQEKALALSDHGTQSSLRMILCQRKILLAQWFAFAAAWLKDASKALSNYTSTNSNLELSLLVLFLVRWSIQTIRQPSSSDGSRGFWVLSATTCSLPQSLDLFRGSLSLGGSSWRSSPGQLSYSHSFGLPHFISLFCRLHGSSTDLSLE